MCTLGVHNNELINSKGGVGAQESLSLMAELFATDRFMEGEVITISCVTTDYPISLQWIVPIHGMILIKWVIKQNQKS